MSCFLEILKCILCCEDEDIGIIDNRTSLRDPFSRTSTYNTYHRSSSIDESYRSSQTWSYPSSSLNSSPGNEWLYKIHSSTTSTKSSQSSVKPVLYPPSLLPSFETSFTAQKPSPSPKGLTPPKPTTPSLKPSSSSFKPSPSLKPTLSELGKGKYKTLNPEDTLPIKPILYPPSPLPSFKMSFTAEKPSPSPKGLTPPKSTTPSPKRSSSSSKPSPSLKPTLSELGKGKYKTVDPKDTLPIYMIPKDIEDLIKRDIVPEVLKKPLSASTYQDFFAALLYAEDSYIEKWSSFELENVSMELHSATIYQKSGKNKHSKASKKMDDKTFAVFKVDSLSMTRPFLLSRDFVFAKRVGEETEPFQEKSAVHRILNIRAPPPFLVKGPLCATFNGNSESISKQLSRTGLVVKEAVLQIYRRHPQSKILVCAPINSTCDVLTRSLKIDIPASDIFRANAAFREIEGVPIDILPSCLYKRDTECFSCPSLHELREFRVIFSTFTSSYRLYNAGISTGHFSHIFLVDASSSTEPETLVALANFADDSTTVIITGAPGNCSSTVRSDIAREKGLRISYFERLCKLSPFKNDDPMFIAQLKDRSL
ncbi:hypothetical protein GOBAR_AA34708 [Gossypium barbadense]|uniref:RNA helicase SDE3 n=1 Tax=Gossypium barbadense TaxID=3634 RepID=A0A2P5W4G4_GOSBA|nr:hypothetical protein GOBAR_AA34708 [Gossypium barbadense]